MCSRLKHQVPPKSVNWRTMLFILLFSGLCSGLQHQYHLVEEPKTWSEAQSYCREQYTDLATIDDMEDMNRLLDAAGSGYMGSVWIGLHDKPDMWRWSLSDEYLNYGVEGPIFSNWEPFEPNNNGGQQFCVGMTNGEWFDMSCKNEYYFVCYRNNTNMTDMQTSASGRFVYVQEGKSWKDAQQYCRQHFTDLASVRNETENDELKELVPHLTSVWIGLFRDSWIWWSGGGNSSLKYWMNGHPDNSIFRQNCVMSDIRPVSLGKWNDRSCETKSNFMCHESVMKKHLFKIKLTSEDSALDLNDPAVAEAILKQMETKMRETGFSKHIQLAWTNGPDGQIFHEEENETNFTIKMDNSSTTTTAIMHL